MATKNTSKDPKAANKAYCLTGTNSVTARALNPIDVVKAVKKIGFKRFSIVRFAAFFGSYPFFLSTKSSERVWTLTPIPKIIMVGIRAALTTVIGKFKRACNPLTKVTLVPMRNQGNKHDMNVP